MSKPVNLPKNFKIPTKTIVLVGLMGAGKSTIGRRLAQALGMDFFDSDHEIAEAAGCSISDVFEIYGEPIFRDLEKRVLTRLLSGTPCVLATGGGAFIQPAVRALIKEHGISIWLRAELEILVERVSRKNTRPLLEQGNKKEIMSKLMQDRYPIYAEADMAIDSDEGAHEKVVKRVLEALADER